MPTVALSFRRGQGDKQVAVMIGVDPHKASHTAAAIDETESVLGELKVRSGANQVERLLDWAAQFEQRTWAVEGAGGLGYLLAQQLVAAGERVLDVQPKLAARVRLLSTATTNKNDPNDALSVAMAALTKSDRGARRRQRRRDEAAGQAPPRSRQLVPGGYSGGIYVSRAEKLLGELEPEGAVAAAR